jgi:hypothetical protein
MTHCFANLNALQDTFKNERRCLKTVTSKTLIWYKDFFRAFGPSLIAASDVSAVLFPPH